VLAQPPVDQVNNPWFPLPRNYPELGPEEQKQARLLGVSTQNTPQELVYAWDLFRRLYLMSPGEGFFYHKFVPSPSFHYEAIHDVGRYARNILAAPRGNAKSVILGTELPLFLALTRPYYRIVLSLATDKQIEERFDTIIKQYTENPYILEDFGNMQPPRGKGIWNHHHLQLLNGSKLVGYSVTGRKRGARPDLFILDDPEFDVSGTTGSATLLIDQFETFLFRQVIPMLEDGSAIFWVGTMISRRSFLYHACHGDDSRFNFWNRKVLRARTDTSGNRTPKLLWDVKWSKDILAAREAEIGSAAFAAEYLNAPSSEQAKVLTIDPTKNEYYVDPDFPVKPFDPASRVYYNVYDTHSEEWVAQVKPASELFGQMYRVITFDPARGLTSHHDYSCLAVMGVDSNNCVWLLDMWMGRDNEGALLATIYKYIRKWNPRAVGVESVGMQIQLVDAMKDYLQKVGDETRAPRIVPINYKSTTRAEPKAARIATLEWRFEQGKMKYPSHRSGSWPIKQLYQQTSDFTYDLALLSFDDAIDSVAMINYIIHGRGSKEHTPLPDKTPLQLMKSGQMHISGIPIISGLATEEIDSDLLDILVDKTYAKTYKKTEAEAEGRFVKPPFVVSRRPLKGIRR